MNEKNSELERALAGKLIDIYKKLAERAEECDKYRKILYSQFVKVNKIFGFQFNEIHQNEITRSKDARIKDLEKKLLQREKMPIITKLASEGMISPETAADLLKHESKPVIK